MHWDACIIFDFVIPVTNRCILWLGQIICIFIFTVEMILSKNNSMQHVYVRRELSISK